MKSMYNYHKRIIARFLPFIGIFIYLSFNLYSEIIRKPSALDKALQKNIEALNRLTLESSLLAQIDLLLMANGSFAYKN